MAKKKAQVQDKTPSTATSEFLTALAKRLEGEPDVDAGLAKVLTTHVLVASQAANSAQLAKDAIVKLAAERAKPAAKDNGADDEA
jgi:hypothetical protein